MITMKRLILGLGCFFLAASAAAQDKIEYYHVDAIGSVRAVTGAAGAIVARHDFFPFGEEYLPPPATSDALRFAGKERDPETSLDYFGARYYRATAARFTSVDPVNNLQANLANPQRWNRYAYATNRPLVVIDPDGREPVPTHVQMSVAPDRFANAIYQMAAGFLGSFRGMEGRFSPPQTTADKVFFSIGELGVIAPAFSSPRGGSARAAVGVGPYAGRSIPARSPGRNFTAAERAQINEIGRDTGCHTCGGKSPGTTRDNFVPDHQPATALNPQGGPQRLYPQCLGCSKRQGGMIGTMKRLEREGGW